MKKVIMFKSSGETLDFFSEQIAARLEELGYDIFWWNLRQPVSSREGYDAIADKSACVVFTINFTGFSNESQTRCEGDTTVFERDNINVVNFLVDHPIYYYPQFTNAPDNMEVFCIDRDHAKYVTEFYPDKYDVYFVPSAGTKVLGKSSVNDDSIIKELPYSDRPIEVLFCGNLIEQKHLGDVIAQMEPEVGAMCRGFFDEMVSDPDKTIDEVIVGGLYRNFPDATLDEIKKANFDIQFLDLYIRAYYREKVLKSIVDAGIPITILGENWDMIGFDKCPNVTLTGMVDSFTCLEYMTRAKISLNVMPWFKRGSHDRVYNAMLNKSVVLTDSSSYFDEVLKDGENCRIYDLKQVWRVPDILSEMLANVRECERIAAEGYATAKGFHEWANRADEFVAQSKYF